MPRKYNRKRPAPKKKSKFSKYIGYADKASKALALAAKVARMVNVEYKRDIESYNSTVDSSGVINNICNPAEGDTFNSRDGISIKPMRVSGRIFLRINPSATATVVRLILFRGKQENRVTYTPTDIIHSASGLLYQNPKEYQNRFHTKFIYDKTYYLNQAARQCITLDWNFKLFGHILFGNGSTEVENGGLYILMVSNEATNTPTVQYTLQTTFTDN